MNHFKNSTLIFFGILLGFGSLASTADECGRYLEGEATTAYVGLIEYYYKKASPEKFKKIMDTVESSDKFINPFPDGSDPASDSLEIRLHGAVRILEPQLDATLWLKTKSELRKRFQQWATEAADRTEQKTRTAPLFKPHLRDQLIFKDLRTLGISALSPVHEIDGRKFIAVAGNKSAPNSRMKTKLKLIEVINGRLVERNSLDTGFELSKLSWHTSGHRQLLLGKKQYGGVGLFEVINGRLWQMPVSDKFSGYQSSISDFLNSNGRDFVVVAKNESLMLAELKKNRLTRVDSVDLSETYSSVETAMGKINLASLMVGTKAFVGGTHTGSVFLFEVIDGKLKRRFEHNVTVEGLRIDDSPVLCEVKGKIVMAVHAETGKGKTQLNIYTYDTQNQTQELNSSIVSSNWSLPVWFRGNNRWLVGFTSENLGFENGEVSLFDWSGSEFDLIDSFRIPKGEEVSHPPLGFTWNGREFFLYTRHDSKFFVTEIANYRFNELAKFDLPGKPLANTPMFADGDQRVVLIAGSGGYLNLYKLTD